MSEQGYLVTSENLLDQKAYCRSIAPNGRDKHLTTLRASLCKIKYKHCYDYCYPMTKSEKYNHFVVQNSRYNNVGELIGVAILIQLPLLLQLANKKQNERFESL